MLVFFFLLLVTELYWKIFAENVIQKILACLRKNLLFFFNKTINATSISDKTYEAHALQLNTVSLHY